MSLGPQSHFPAPETRPKSWFDPMDSTSQPPLPVILSEKIVTLVIPDPVLDTAANVEF